MSKPRARRCPACGLVNRPTVSQCECGQGFDDESPEDLYHLHMHRLTIGWMMVVGFILLMLFCIALVFVVGGLMVFPAGGCAAAILRGLYKISHAREGLRDVKAMRVALPKARLVS